VLVGRKKSYDRRDIAARAMRLFWERGYHATSTRNLTDAMGINPYSLYAEFGSKEALYAAAVAHYEDTVVERHFGSLETEDASVEQVRAVLDFFGDNGRREHSELGCLLCNSGTEQAPTPAHSQAVTQRFIDRLTAAFRNALTNARLSGALASDAPIEDLARSFPTVLVGIFVLSRAKVDAAVIRAAADEALRRLDAVTTA
jgi:TetR/AcrR family transcriptional repressor of nem operon